MFQVVLLFLIGLVVMPTIHASVAGATLREPAPQPRCDYVPAERAYSCKHITTNFPNVFYGNYHLHCGDCALGTFTPETFPHNNDLISINLTASRVGGITKYAFQKLTTLQYIYLQHNDLRRIDAKAFDGLRQVFELHLEHNSLKNLHRGWLNGFEANAVIVHHNQLEEIAADTFEGIFGAMSLDLSDNKLSKLHRDSFAHLKGLEYLDLHGNALCRLPMGLFKHLRLLKDLNLAGNRFKSFQFGAFSGLPNLYALNVSGNDLNAVDPAWLTPLEGLSLLDVSDTGVDFVDAVEIYNSAPQLKHLGLAANRWNCHVLQNIVQFLKGKRIEVIEHFHYDVTNIKGIACADAAVTDERVDFEIFYNYVQKLSANEEKKVC